MSISEVSIKNNVLAWMLMIGLILFGAISYSRMGVSLLPDVDFPVVSIYLTMAGATPDVMEMTVVDQIEDALTSVEGVKGISSNSQSGSASITVEFELSKNIDVAVQEIQTAINRVQKQLPADIDPPSIRKSNPENSPIMYLTVSADNMTRSELMKLARYNISDEFSTVAGVGEISLGGYADPNLRVWIKKEKLDKYELTAADVVNTIAREHSEPPGGLIQTSTKEFNIRAMGEAPTVEEFNKLTINGRGGSPNFKPIPIKDIADIRENTQDIRSYSRTGGKNAISMGIRKQPLQNSVEVAKAVKAKLAELNTRLPPGVSVDIRFDTTKFIEDSVNELSFTLLLSAVLTALVCWLFLGSISATINVILAIPTSVVGSFIVLYFLNFTLNSFTLLGLSLAIGIVVDDAIMVLENIVRHREAGEGKVLAALKGANQITFAAIAATAAIIAIFLPVAFMQGIIGRYFLQFGVTLTVAVLLSLLEALTLTPMRTSRFLHVGERTTFIGKAVEGTFNWCAKMYKKLITASLKAPVWTVVGALAIFGITLYIGLNLKQEFIPAQDQGRLMISVTLPTGTSLPASDLRMKELEALISKKPEVDSYLSIIGAGNRVNSGMLMLNLVPREKRKVSAQQFINNIRKELKTIKDMKISVIDPSLMSLSTKRGMPVEYSVRGPDFFKIIEYSGLIQERMEKSGKMVDVDSNYMGSSPEIEVVPDREKARDRGVAISEITQTVSVMMATSVVGKYSSGDRRLDIRIGLPIEDRNGIQTIKELKVRNNRSELIPLSEVVTIKEAPALPQVTREDRQRAINVTANVAAGSSQKDAMTEMEKIGKEVLPSGYYLVASGVTKTYKESNSGLLFALVLGIAVAYMVLASQFNSFVDPFTVLVALPFSVSGALMGLFLTHQTLNIYSYIGLILLMGIVKKNSILLVDFTNAVRKRGLSTKEALIEACPIRLRPILMTSIATIAAAVPPALAFGPGAETRVPMAVAVIAGVFLSTLLTLFVVPSVYLLLEVFRLKNQPNVAKMIVEESKRAEAEQIKELD